jgi:predicted transcriptional regulator
MPIDKERLKRNSKALLKGILDGTIDIPDNALVFLEPETMNEIITPKRLELISLIKKKRPSSVNKLASLSGRLKQAVVRDLKILEKYGLVMMERKGRYAKPVLKRKYVLFSLAMA